MKFGKRIPEAVAASTSLCKAEDWMDYKMLKKSLKKLLLLNKQNPNQNITINKAERFFFQKIKEEMQKVECCFQRLENSLMEKIIPFTKIYKQFEYEKVAKCLAFVHMKLLLLESYAVINYCGFTKILKKHDKRTGFQTREKFIFNIVNSKNFAAPERVSKMLQIFSSAFERLKISTGNVPEDLFQKRNILEKLDIKTEPPHKKMKIGRPKKDLNPLHTLLKAVELGMKSIP